MPSTRRSGLSATVGLALVVGLLLVGGTLAVSGGGILSSGGRLGVEPVATAEAAQPAAADDNEGELDPGTDPPGELPPSGGEPVVAGGTKFDFTCDDAAITDLSRSKWNLSRFVAGSRIEDGYDQVIFELSRAGSNRARNATDVQLEWMSPSEVSSRYGAPDRVQGSRALVATFDGPVEITVNQALDSLLLEREDIEQIRNIQTFKGTDDKLHAVIGLRSDSCARLEARGWNKNAKAKQAKVLLQVERFDS